MPIGLPHVTLRLESAPAALTRGLGAAKPVPTEAEIKKAAQDFESLLLNQMIKGLRRTVPEAEPKGHEHQMYQEMLDERLAQELAGRGGIGIADALRRYMSPRPAPPQGSSLTPPSLSTERNIKPLEGGHR
jgi:flagellar protein FlgJ